MWDPLQSLKEKTELDKQIARARLSAILEQEEWIDKFIKRISCRNTNETNKL